VRASWTARVAPLGVPGRWLRWLHIPLAAAGLPWLESAAWARSLTVLLVLALEWPFCIRLTEGVEVYMPVMWTSAAAAYLLGPAILPVFWLAALLGFALTVVLDSAGIVRAVGLAEESARRWRGQSFALDSVADGDIRHSCNLAEHAVRVTMIAGCARLHLSIAVTVLVAETVVTAGRYLAPIPGRMAPSRTWARIAQALGPDMPVVTLLLHVVMVSFLVLAAQHGGTPGFATASLSTLTLHAILKRLNDTRLESERRREELVAMQSELDRRQHLATIGQTAATVFHQVGRHHGAIGMYAHLLTRSSATDRAVVREHAARILTSVEEANRVIEELLRFSQDRALNLYPHTLDALLAECVAECAPRAEARGVELALHAAPDVVASLDKHKVKQAIGNLLDNAVDVSAPGSRVDVEAAVSDGRVRVSVRDRGHGVAAEIRDRLFTPFATTKTDGIGLGLTLARELIQAHGGTLEWHPAAQGTVFVVLLPCTG
jgi:signal transduction histidine kinase